MEHFGPRINRRVIRRTSPGCAGGKEPVFKNQITVTPVLGKDLIGFETSIYGQVAQQVASLQDQVVRDQLIAAGWGPPGALELARREEEPLILQLLAALERSSPHTDRTHAWKDEAWLRQRAEAITAGRARLADARGSAP